MIVADDAAYSAFPPAENSTKLHAENRSIADVTAYSWPDGRLPHIPTQTREKKNQRRKREETEEHQEIGESLTPPLPSILTRLPWLFIQPI